MPTWQPGPGATSGNDTYFGDNLDNVADGLGGDDTLYGRGGADTLTGNAGNDILLPGDDIVSDTIDGGDDYDTLDYSDVAQNGIWAASTTVVRTFTGDVAADTYTHIEQVRGSNAGDFLQPNAAGMDAVDGGGGNDYIAANGVPGMLVTGGAGGDFFYSSGTAYTITDFQYGIDRFIGGSITGMTIDGADTILTISAGSIRITGINSHTLAEWQAQVSAGDWFFGTSGGDTRTGTAFADWYWTGSGNDNLDGAAGDDTLLGGLGSDTLQGGAGNDTLEGGSSADNLSGGDNDDYLNGGSEADILNGDNGDDILAAGYTDLSIGDQFNGGAGNDTLGIVLSNGVVAFAVTTITSIERIAFLGGNTAMGQYSQALFYSSQVGVGLSATAQVTGSAFTDVLNLGMDATGTFNVSGFTFSNWTAGTDQVIIVGSNGDDTVTGTVVNDDIQARDGNDTLNGNNGDDYLTGESGNDTLNGGSGVDHMFGNDGDDVYYVDNLGDVVSEGLNQGTDVTLVTVTGYTLASNVEIGAVTVGTGLTLTGNTLNNLLYGSAGADTLNGGDGDDTLQGGAANDAMSGGLGNDTFYVAQAGDTVSENFGEGTDATIVQMTSAYTLAANVEIGATFLSAAVNITGNGLDNQIYGGAGNDTLNGASGNDTLQGNGGSDTMIGGIGNDTFFIEDAGDAITENLNEGTDAAIVFTSSYTLAANVEIGARFLTTAYTITGNALDNQLYGNNGNDTLNGGDGNDTLQGGAGNDTMVGGLGNDTYLVEQAGDVVTENSGEGNDAVIVLIGSYTLAANVEVGGTFLTSGVSITGNGLDNRLYGNAGADTLSGAAGADLLEGGAGADTLTGGSENDTFMFVAGQGNGDTITDFAGNGAAAGDVLRFSGYGTSGGGATFVQLDSTHWQINSADGTIHDTITLSNGASVDASDWLFV